MADDSRIVQKHLSLDLLKKKKHFLLLSRILFYTYSKLNFDQLIDHELLLLLNSLLYKRKIEERIDKLLYYTGWFT